MPALPPTRDSRLLDRIAAGDAAAWEDVDRRHRAALRRYVGTLARPGTVDPDDVVQDALVKAHAHLRGGGEAPDHLRPWLYRLTRNAAIDAIRAGARRGETVALDGDPPGTAESPERVLLRRDRLRGITADIAALPDGQRAALLARSVDGRPVDEVAAQLGMSAGAVHMTVQRARESLMRSERARDAACDEIRPLLHVAHDRGARPSEPARLHLRSCPACRTYRADLRRVDRRLRGLTPPVLPLLLAAGVGTKTALVGAVAGTSAVVVAGGLLVSGPHRADAGDPAPFKLIGFKPYADQHVVRGAPVPGRTSIVTAKVRVPPAASPRVVRHLVLRCPAGMLVGGLEAPANQVTAVNWNPDPPILQRREGSARFRVARQAGAPGPSVATIGIACRRPDANGSILAHPRRPRPGERSAHVCDLGTTAQRRAKGVPTQNTMYLRAHGSMTKGALTDGQPISVPRRSPGGRPDRIGRRVFVRADDRYFTGWISPRFVC